MQSRTITEKDRCYPDCLKSQSGYACPQLTVAGNLAILVANSAPITGLFCSRKCPGNLILPAFDQISALRDAGHIVVSGFHSEMERECLNILLRGSQPIIICPARAIENMRFPSNWQTALSGNRLLILSPFDKSQKRVTAKLADQRNNLVAALSDKLFIIHAESGTGTFNLAVESMRAGKRIFAIKNEENKNLINAGAVPI